MQNSSILWKISLCNEGSDDIHSFILYVVADDLDGAVKKAKQWVLDYPDPGGENLNTVSAMEIVDWVCAF